MSHEGAESGGLPCAEADCEYHSKAGARQPPASGSGGLASTTPVDVPNAVRVDARALVFHSSGRTCNLVHGSWLKCAREGRQ
eukprot:7596237-Alexandrium_andersonii.AAC.1